MAIPGFQDLMLPVLAEASKAPDVWTSDLVEQMSRQFELSDEEKAQLLPSGRQTVIANRTHWALAYLSKTKLLERIRRAHYAITDRGRQSLAEAPDRIDLKYLARFLELARFRGERAQDATETPPARIGEPPDELIRATFKEIDAVLRDMLIERILAGKPEFFERLVVQLLVAMGFGGQHGLVAEAIGRSGDGGLDGVIDQDALGLDRVYVQAKRYQADNTVGSGAIREFFGSLDAVKATKGVFLTTSSFTRGAREAAEQLSRRIVLVDGELLAALMIRYDVGVRAEETFHLKKVDEDFFLEE